MKGPSKTTGVGGSLSRKSGRDGRRWVAGKVVDHLMPNEAHRANAAPKIKGGVAYCASCHAIYHRKHWHLDEAEYQRLASDPAVESLTCPSCKAIETGDLLGELHVKLDGLERFHEQILNTIYNEEQRARAQNPHERIGNLKDGAGEIEVDTVSPFLVHRIADLLKKTFHGTEFSSNYLPGQRSARIMWGKEELIEK